MRQLTDREQEALSEARQEYEPCYVGYFIEELAGFDAGFITALDHSSAQIAALTAERDALRTALENMLYIFDNGYDKADSLGRMRCDEARKVLGE